MASKIDLNIKAGYDYYRVDTDIATLLTKEKKLVVGGYDRGFIIGLEAYPLQLLDSKIKIGAGFEYNFGEKTLRYRYKDVVTTNGHLYRVETSFVPVYLASNFEIFRFKPVDLKFYTTLRLGYVFMDKHTIPHYFPRHESGVYYGLALGVAKDWFLAELVYDGRYNFEKRTYKQHDDIPFNEFHHKLGLRVGINLISDIKPKIIEKVKVVEPEKNIVVGCFAQQKKCAIHGFEVDGN